MANIKQYTDKIRTAVYGKEVRGSLAEGMETINTEVELNTKDVNAAVEDISKFKETTTNNIKSYKDSINKDINNFKDEVSNAEKKREASETLRTNAEKGRVSSESSRMNEFSQIKSEAQKLMEDMNNTIDGTITDEVFNAQYDDVSGSEISLTKTFEGFTKDLVIEGRTLQNLSPSITDTTKYLLNNCKVSDGKFRLFAGADVNASACRVLPKSMNLIPDTEYVVIVNILKNITGVPLALTNYKSALAPIDNSNFSMYGKSTVNCRCASNGTDTSMADLYFCIPQTGGNLTNYIDFEFSVYIKSEYDKLNLPVVVDGIKSVGDLNENKITIIVHNKNCITECKNWYIQGSNPYCLRESQETLSYVGKVTKGTYISSKTGGDRSALAFFSDYPVVGTLPEICVLSGEKITIPYDGYLVYYVSSNIVTAPPVITAQIERGVIATEFEVQNSSKKEILLPISDGLKSLPNGICDRLYEKNGEVSLEQNVGKITLDGSEAWKTGSTDGDGSTIRFIIWNGNLSSSWNKPLNLVCNNFVSNGNNYSYDVECIAIDGQKYLGIRILKSKLQTPTVEGFKNWLKNNPTTVYYQLENPIYHKLDLYDLDLEMYGDVTNIFSNNKIPPNLKFKNAKTLKAATKNNSLFLNKTKEKVKDLYKEVKEKANVSKITANVSTIGWYRIGKISAYKSSIANVLLQSGDTTGNYYTTCSIDFALSRGYVPTIDSDIVSHTNGGSITKARLVSKGWDECYLEVYASRENTNIEVTLINSMDTFNLIDIVQGSIPSGWESTETDLIGRDSKKAPIGYSQQSNGVITQWGQFDVTLEGSQEVTVDGRYPTTFPNIVGAKSINVKWSGVGQPGTAYANNLEARIIHKDNSSFIAVIKSNNIPNTKARLEWSAIGY